MVLGLLLWISLRARFSWPLITDLFFSTVIFSLLDGCFSKNAILLSPLPIDQDQECCPFANQLPESDSVNCETLTFASCTSNLWEQMCDFSKCMRFHPKLIQSLQGRQQNLSLQINPIGSAEPCCPHDNIVSDHSCYECRKSSGASVLRTQVKQQ